MARFGLLFLRGGKGRETQIIPRYWVEESTRSYSDTAGSGGYGYMWWGAVDGRHLPEVDLPAGSYSERGGDGHYILVIPSAALVIVHRVNTDERGRAVSNAQFGRLVKLIQEARKLVQ